VRLPSRSNVYPATCPAYLFEALTQHLSATAADEIAQLRQDASYVRKMDFFALFGKLNLDKGMLHFPKTNVPVRTYR
jgi:hypothetical protein